jgi:hypothetical protein
MSLVVATHLVRLDVVVASGLVVPPHLPHLILRHSLVSFPVGRPHSNH